MRVGDFTYVISGIGVVALAVVGTRRRLGWMLSASSQALLIGYGLYTRQYGFVVFPPIIISIQLSHMWRWRHEGWRKLNPRSICRCVDDTLDERVKEIEIFLWPINSIPGTIIIEQQNIEQVQTNDLSEGEKKNDSSNILWSVHAGASTGEDPR